MTTFPWNFSDRARTVVCNAQEVAVEHGHGLISPLHLAIGLLRERHGVAAAVLTKRRIPVSALEGDLEEHLPPFDVPTGAVSELSWSGDALRVVEQARAESFEMGHRYVGAEHILLGILRDADGIAAVTMARHGIRAEEARAEVRTLLAGTLA